ncbi:hypothetical protein HanPSC8_Chr02g0062971 [Helianthus annuus]|nr:hypothetical protein HanPSC8_Chr02g0062971 [Helianthus annuus]
MVRQAAHVRVRSRFGVWFDPVQTRVNKCQGSPGSRQRVLFWTVSGLGFRSRSSSVDFRFRCGSVNSVNRVDSVNSVGLSQLCFGLVDSVKPSQLGQHRFSSSQLVSHGLGAVRHARFWFVTTLVNCGQPRSTSGQLRSKAVNTRPGNKFK